MAVIFLFHLHVVERTFQIDRSQLTLSWLTLQQYMANTKHLFFISDPIEPYIKIHIRLNLTIK